MMNRVMANDAATPTTPQCKPMTNPSTVTGVENRRKRNITSGLPMAWVVAQLSVCSVVPTPARLSHCNTGTAASHLCPRTTGTKSAAMAAMPRNAGTFTALITSLPRAQASASRFGSCWIFAKAEKSTCCSGCEMRLTGRNIVL